MSDAPNMGRNLILFVALPALSILIAAAQGHGSCGLPSGLSKEIAARYPNARVIGAADLDEGDKEQFQREHGSACPGFTDINFYGDGKPTLAVVLSLGGAQGATTQLIVAHEIRDRWELRPLDQDITGPAPVVWPERPGKYDDVYGEKTIESSNPVIVLCAYDSWAILYAWVGNRVEKIWIRD
jgi:hypothetical protein